MDKEIGKKIFYESIGELKLMNRPCGCTGARGGYASVVALQRCWRHPAAYSAPLTPTYTTEHKLVACSYDPLTCSIDMLL